MYNALSFFVKKSRFTYFLLIGLIFLGFYSISSIPKESMPEIKIPVGIVTTILPGGSAKDVEKLITNKIEEGLNNLNNLNKLTSTSRESISVVVAEFNAQADLDKSISELKDEVDKIKPKLPQEAEDPYVSEVDFSNQPIIITSISGNLPPTEFISLSEEVERQIQLVSGVSDITISGLRKKETQVIVSKEKLDDFGISLTEIVNAIAMTNSSLPIGSITSSGINYNLKFEGDINDPSEIKDIAILSRNSEPIFIRDIAFVSDGIEDVSTFSRVSVDGELSRPAVTFSIYKRAGGDITKIADNIESKLEDMQKNGVLKGMDVSFVYNMGDYIKKDLINLSTSGLQTVLLVILTLLITIGWKEAIIAGLAIPLSFLLAFIGLYATGNTINFISLFSLILAVGILVDSAIVVTEGMHMSIKEENGDGKRAALKTIKEFYKPLISGTLTTIAVFIPLFFISGITGKFIAGIPATIIFVLTASIFVALGLIPLISSLILRNKIKKENSDKSISQWTLKQEEYADKLKTWYKEKLLIILGNRKKERWFIFIMVGLLIISFILPAIGLVKISFFPEEDEDYIFVDLEMTQGTEITQTDLIMRQVEEIIYEEKDIKSFTTTIGAGNSFRSGVPGSKYGSITVNLIPKNDRNRTMSDIVDSIKEKTLDIKGADIGVFKPDSGPPVGAPVLVDFVGDNLDELDLVANRAEKLLSDIEGTTEVDSDTKNSEVEFVLTIDKAKASQLGISPFFVAQTLRTAINGTKATSIKKLEEDIDVIVKLDLNPEYKNPHDTNKVNIDTIKQIPLKTMYGSVLLGSIIDISIQKASAIIQHKDGKRVISVTSELTENGSIPSILNEFYDRSEELEIPEGVEMVVGGESAETDQSFKDMFMALIMGLVLMFAVIILQFNSYRFTIYILSVVPFSFIGILFGLMITGEEFSFPSILGFVALAGIVVNNSIILIDKMNHMRLKNPDMRILDVVLKGAASRLRPILLTTITTVIGVIPLIFASDMWAPLSYSIMFGLSFSVILTLIIIPVLYHRWPGKVS